tara:strand:+ start:2213 stop:2389 length:177 start_codon:yes stop_codon:yes gene_type:complete
LKNQNKKDKLKISQKESEVLENLDKELKEIISTNEALNVSIKKFINDISQEKLNNKKV